MGEDGSNVKSETQNAQQDSKDKIITQGGGSAGAGQDDGAGSQPGGPGGNRGRGGGGGGGRGGFARNDRKGGGGGGGGRFGGGGRGGGQGPNRGGPASNMNDMQMQMKMSESMIEGMMDDSMTGMGQMNQRSGGSGMNRSGGGGGRGGRGGGRQSTAGGGGDRGDRNMMQGGRSQDERLMERIMSISGPTHDLPPHDMEEKKFNSRSRLYVGNLTNDVTEEELTNMFLPYGETTELFLNKEKNFAFLKIDFRVNAEKAKRELDGSIRKGRPLKVRFAPNSSILKVKNLTPWVSNELLAHAFGVFGDIERAMVITDERGKSIGEGIVEFSRKPNALQAIRKCNEGCFFLTSSLRPVIVEAYEPNDDTDGYPDKNLPKKHPDFYKARDVGPRFASTGSFEHEYGTRWKQLHELYKQKEDALKREMIMEEEKLEAQMEYARYEHETEVLREQLRIREADRERQKREWEMKERRAEELISREEELRKRQQEEMALRIRRQEEELHRRQQENNLFMQEQAMRSAGGQGGGSVKNFDGIPPERDGYPSGDGGNLPVDPKSFMDQYNNLERANRGGGGYDERGQIMDLMDMRVDMSTMGNMGNMGNMGAMGPGNMGNMGNMGNNRGGGGNGGRWQGGGNDRQRADDFPNKRRRY